MANIVPGISWIRDVADKKAVLLEYGDETYIVRVERGPIADGGERDA